MNAAKQCRDMGLVVGDTIEGKEQLICDGHEWWIISRLTLLWVGEEIAVWSETHISCTDDKWSDKKEAAHWTLDRRKWEKVRPE